MIAGILALLTAGVQVWFALYNVGFGFGPTGGWSGIVVQNIVGGVLGAVGLFVAAGFMFARRIAAAWTLVGLCVLYVVAIFVAPILRGTGLADQLTFAFGFEKSNGVAVGLTVVFGVLTAIAAAIAGSVDVGRR